MFERARGEPMTIDEFVAWDPRDGLKYELIDGFPVLKHRDPHALGFATTEHQLLVGAVFAILYERAPKHCRVLTDMLVRAPRAKGYFLPDVAVTCDRRDLAVRGMGIYEHPALVVEVLSASTAPYDLTDKLDAYVALGAEYLVVDSLRRHVRVARPMDDDRDGPGSFAHAATSGIVRLRSFDLAIDVDALYEGVLPA